MIKIIKYDDTKTFMYPNGSIATPERIQLDFPAVTIFPHIIETDENSQICYAVQNLSAMRSLYDIDQSLSEDDAISAIEAKRNAEYTIIEPTPEERIASALEYQILASMPDVEEV